LQPNFKEIIMREFNDTGLCVPTMHYMADTGDKIDKIFQMVETGKYFTINRGRQYGKTTTIYLLRKRLPPDYICISITFQYSSDRMFEDEKGFSQELLGSIRDALTVENEEEANLWQNPEIGDFKQLGRFFTQRCKGKKIVLIIDESDEATNNDIFVRFIKMLRDKYLLRNAGDDCTFQSVILAGVYDIRNLKMKMVLQGNYTPSQGEQMLNSPWNIAVDFNIDMSLSIPEIASMLSEYENDHHTGMDIQAIAKEIRYYTNGYPYLVSRICLLIVRDLESDWTLNGVQEAIKLILWDNSTLFDDLIKKIQSYPDLDMLMRDLTVGNIEVAYNPDNPTIKLGLMFSFLRREGNRVKIHNRIFEIRITDYYISLRETNWNERNKLRYVNGIVHDGIFDMELCLRKFQKHYAEIYTEKDIKFLERDGKLIFLTYLKPFINGVGFYHFESQTSEAGKIDLVVDFMQQQFILEIKLWYGENRHQSAFEQLAGYLRSKNHDKGYLLTFDFRHKSDEQTKTEPQWVEYDGKRIFDVIASVGADD
jgi:hypothetical protein